MTARPTHAYCPTCKDDSAIDAEAHCLWCGGETRTGRKRGKRKGVWGKLDDRHLRALYSFHADRGVSIRELGRRVWKPAGFTNAHSAGVAISSGFKRLGLKGDRTRWETIPESGRENYRKLVRAVLLAAQPDAGEKQERSEP